MPIIAVCQERFDKIESLTLYANSETMEVSQFHPKPAAIADTQQETEEPGTEY